ncbi:MAG: phosphoenolpyruvate--protein phosphotransferase, partial [Planctomycetota bacterium]|nr:phosphoenolpyruvate--protein phosphotransferase [Planctomycetota bacterium]
MDVLKGIPVSSGVVIGTVFVLDDVRRRIPRRTVPADRVPREHERLDDALSASINELQTLRGTAENELGGEAAKIFAFHIGVLSDPSLIKPMHDLIEAEHVTAEHAVSTEFQRVASMFAGMTDGAFATKVDDIWDLDRRVIRHLVGEHMNVLKTLDHEAVVIARDLTPSQTAGFERDKVVGFATDAGGRTSHTAIVARAIGIPAVVGLGHLASRASDNDSVIVDGDRGVVILNPDEETLDQYASYIAHMREFRLSLGELAEKDSVTTDGVEIELLGNIEFPHEIDSVLGNGGDGVGLFRTEFLYLTNPHEPTEDEQVQSYVDCIERLKGRPLTIRTFDLGSDKQTQAREEIPERNPALGCRSIRYCLQNLPMFKRQLRAILRASASGPVKIMFPLVTNPLELRQAKMILHDVMEDLDDEKIDFDRDMPVGIMIETPAAAVM